MDNQLITITVETRVNAPAEYVWKTWTTPTDIMQWNIPFADWHCPRVENDVRTGGNFLFRMEAKDGCAGFDHAGKYDRVINHQLIEYTVSDGRKSIIQFVPNGGITTLIETFEPEKENPAEMQKEFCQSVLNRFKKYAENKTTHI
jgi:uncharacterized protein YndB with AHSA1/START domain